MGPGGTKEWASCVGLAGGLAQSHRDPPPLHVYTCRLMEELDGEEAVRQLPYVIPVLMSRMALPEPSEEITWLLVS